MAADEIEIPGTFRTHWPGSSYAHELASAADSLLTVWLRPKADGELDVARAFALGSTLPGARAYAERKELRIGTEADPAATERLTAYLRQFGIRIVGAHWRAIVISGPIDRRIEAFGAPVSIFADAEGKLFRHRSKGLHVRRDIASLIRGVFGLHQWPRSRKLGALSRHAKPLSADEIVKRYDFPAADGAGQTIGIVQFRGEFKPDDFDRCMKAQNVAPAAPIVKRVDGTAVTHAIETTKDLEAALDAQVIGALAPGARIVVYEAIHGEPRRSRDGGRCHRPPFEESNTNVYGRIYRAPVNLEAMRVSRWGNNLAIRLPASVAGKLGLLEGDEIEIEIAGPRQFRVGRDMRRIRRSNGSKP